MSEVAQRTIEEAHEIAAREGLVCIIPEEDELLLDLDNGATVREDVLAAIYKTLSDDLTIRPNMLITVSKNGNKHAYIKCSHALHNMARIAIQACLGSDPVREILSVMRDRLSSEAPTVLFETSMESRKVALWRARMKTAIWPTKGDL